jgi:hypothetical protein
MDYNDGEELHKYQWDLVQDPQGMWFTGLIDEEEAAVLDISIFDEEDLEKYNKFINSLIKIDIFNTIYNHIDNSEKHVHLRTLEVNYDNLLELKERYRYSNGFFLNVENEKEAFWGLVEYEPGDENNPHQIVLFSSKNYKLSGGKIRGNGFKHATTIYEEFFHAAHYLYLKENGIYENKTKFFIQTETEVEVAKALIYYIIKFKMNGQCNDILTTNFDNYGIALEPDDKINKEVKDIFRKILKNKELTDKNLNNLKNRIIDAVKEKRKNPGYEKLDHSQINWNFDFLKFLIEKSYK